MKLIFIRALAALLAFASHPGNAAPPIPQWDNNGDAAFVRQLVPMLLGRKAKGTTEVNLLADLIDLHDREAVIRVLMEQAEFNTHWTATLADHLKLQRDNAGSRTQSAACFNEPSTPQASGAGGGMVESAGPANAGQLAQFVRDGNPLTQSYQHQFNMHDLMLSSLALDDLRPLYRAYLWVLASKPPGSGMRQEYERRADVGVAFDDIYLNRNMECMSCHRGSYSTTGVGQRTHPLYNTLDLAMFDHLDVGEPETIDNADYVASCKGCHGDDARGGTARGIRDLSADVIRSNLLSPQSTMPAFPNIAGDENRLLELTNALNGAFGQQHLGDTALRHNGVFRTDLFEPEGDATAMKAPFGIHPECALVQTGTAWQGNLDTFFAGLSDSYDASTVEVDEDFVNGYQALKTQLGSFPAWDQQNAIPGHLGFAYMVAAKITDNVWEQLLGERLTISNQFARNQTQMRMHRYLTEDVFIANDWSLKELIFAIVKSRFFNRRAADVSVLNSAYSIPAVIDPFNTVQRACVDVDPNPGPVSIDPVFVGNQPSGPRAPLERNPALICGYNSVGDTVHRYSPRTLLNSVGSALDWPAPALFPTSSYPDKSLNVAIGQYMADFQPGTKDVGFQALLAWDEQFGRCARPVAGDDWIQRLITSVDAYNADHEQTPLQLRDVVLTLKDWLLQEPVLDGDTPPGGWQPPQVYVNPQPPPPKPGPIYQAPGTQPPPPPPIGSFSDKPQPDYDSATEVELVEILFGLDINDEVTSATFTAGGNDEIPKLRLLCGSYLKTPQFMLAGLVNNDSYESPKLRVCNDGVCSYRQMCNAYSSALDNGGFATECHSASVSKPLSEAVPTRPVPDPPRRPKAFLSSAAVVLDPPASGSVSKLTR